ncbi:MAG: ABC transporter permease, partial [Massilistercora timonensis]
MGILWKVTTKEIRQKPARFAVLVLGMTAAVFLITVMTIFSTSCLQAMIRQEIEENGPYEAVFHNLTGEQAQRLEENGRIRKVWRLAECPRDSGSIGDGEEGEDLQGRVCCGVTYRHRTHGIFKEVNELGAEIDMDPLPEEEREIVFSRRNLTVISSYDITFNNKLLAYYGLNASEVKAGSAWAIGMIDFVITIFAAVILYYVVISGMEEKLKTVGLLDGIGISDGQKRLYIYGENLLAGVLAVPLGMGLGLLALFLSCRELNERFLPTYDLELAVSPLWLGAVLAGSGAVILCSASGLYARARKERILDLVSGYDREEEVNRTTVLLRAKRHFFKAETLLAAKNVILNHRNYGVSCALLVISLCVFLNGMMYVRGLAAPYEKGQDYPKISLWMKAETGRSSPESEEAKNEEAKNTEAEKEEAASREAALEELAGRIEELEGVAQASVVKEANTFHATEGMSLSQIEAYLDDLQIKRYLDFYDSDQYDRQEAELLAQMDLYYVVRVLGVDDDTFQKYLNYGQEKGCIRESEKLPEDSAVLVRETAYEEESFPLIFGGEIYEIPLAFTMLPGEYEEMLRPEYLKTAAESADGLDIPHMAGDSILYVPMETFEQLLGEEPEKTICLEISLDRDVAKTGGIRRADLNEVIYPGNAPKRAGEEGKIREEIEALAQDLGLGGLEVVSFAEEYQQSFFVGGKGLHLMLVAALVSACWLAALLVVLQKDAASLRRRRREFALLQTIGMTRGRILKMLILEHFLYALAGLGFGIPVSLFILTGLYNDGGAPQMTSPGDVPWDLVAGQALMTACVVLLPLIFLLREM